MANWRKLGADGYEFMEPVSIQRFPERLSVEAQLSFNQNLPEDAMKYLCLIYEDESKRGTRSKEETTAIMGEYGAFTEGIKKSGKYVAGEALQPTQTGTTVRVRQGKISTTDGPFAETKEQLGGFYLINATDLNEAIQVASGIPAARTGSVEVRPIWVLGAQESSSRQTA
jgi:hypothetical protein